MTYTPIIYALAGMAVVFCTIGLVSRGKGFQSIPEYFLASRSIRAPLIISLLISGSFSLNGMLYQIYLGYKIGAWALAPQVAWGLSFLWLSKYSARLAGSKGLHNLLGAVFSPTTRVLAAICSIIGLGLQIGWEYGVAKSAFAGLGSPPLPGATATIFTLTVFATGMFYTLAGGMRSNSFSDFLENGLKIGCFVFLGFMLFGVFHNAHVNWHDAIVKSYNAPILELTISGLLANLAFSFVWQFVDMTTWQTAVATKTAGDPGATARSLRKAGFWVFLTPGLLGTALGVELAGKPNLTSDAIFPALIHSLGSSPLILFILTVTLAATVMSFIDGMLLGIGFTFITDLLFQKRVDRDRLLEIPDPATSRDLSYQENVGTIMGWTRGALVVAAIFTSVGLTWFADRFNVGLFDLVYLVVVGQLALFGPALVALSGRSGNGRAGAAAIILALAFGYGLAIYGTANKLPDMVNAASLVAIFISVVVAHIGSKKSVEV